MITIKKLKTLGKNTKKRKLAVLLQNFEQNLLNNKDVDRVYLKNLIEVVIDVFDDDAEINSKSKNLLKKIVTYNDEELYRKLNTLRHKLLKYLGSEPADWDLQTFKSPVVHEINNVSFENMEFSIFLDDIRSPFNLGSIFRTAEAFQVNHIFLSPDCPSPKHPRAKRTAMGAVDSVSWEFINHVDCFKRAKENKLPIFALELGGVSIYDFNFPQKGIGVIGSEELGISPESRLAVNNSLGIVSIPIYGKKGSINVSSAFAIMINSWFSSII